MSDLVRSLDAKREVLRRYATDHDRFSEQEQVLVLQGREIEAAGCHEFALRLLRAYRAELEDPEP